MRYNCMWEQYLEGCKDDELSVKCEVCSRMYPPAKHSYLYYI